LKRLLLVYITLSGLCFAQLGNSSLDLGQAIELAASQPTPADAELAVAQARLQWMEAASQRRIEIKPQSAIWTLVNPLALATNIGAGLLANGKTATPLNVLDARIDVASAAIDVQRNRFQREIEVTETYTALALQQQRANDSVDDQRKLIDLHPSPGGKPPLFGGSGASVHDVSARTANELCGKEEQLKLSYSLFENDQDAHVSVLSVRSASHRA
jgi:hypothetical protein